jgi:hypothetical protein
MSKYTSIKKSIYKDTDPNKREYFTRTGNTIVDPKRREYKKLKREYKNTPWNKK